MRDALLNLSKVKKRVLSLIVDTVFIWLSLYLAFFIRYGFEDTQINAAVLLKLAIFAPLIILPIYARHGLYLAVLRYMDTEVIMAIVKATVYSVLCLVVASFLFELKLPRSVPFVFSALLVLFVGSSRFAIRYWLEGYRLQELLLNSLSISHKSNHKNQGIPVAIYGAGSAGVQLISALDSGKDYKPVAFIDDNPELQGRTISGRKIYSFTHASDLVYAGKVEQILLAIPSAKEQKRRDIIAHVEKLQVPILTMPAIEDLVSGKMRIQEIHEIPLDDLLGRAPIEADERLLYKCVKKQNVMVTGAGGSIGSELCRQISKLDCRRLVLFEHSEYNLYRIEQEMSHIISHLGLEVELVPVLGSINDPGHLLDIMKTYAVETIYHAAAYKHVSIVEQNIAQGVRNNVLGTLYTAQAAILSNVKNFVLLSSDKAVRPTNVMGATKRMSELTLQAFSDLEQVTLLHPHLFGETKSVKNNTRFTMVRFGNVLGSSGSVIPLFREQIATGGPVTVTHPEITRFFMTIPEAAELVIQAGSMGKGGDVFVLDMGDSIKIADLARRMITLSGYSVKTDKKPQGDIEIKFTGLRPGEKLYEELLIGDNVGGTQHLRIFRATEEKVPWSALVSGIENILKSVRGHNYDVTRTLLAQYVSGYKPNSDLVDLLNGSPAKKPVNLLVFDTSDGNRGENSNLEVK